MGSTEPVRRSERSAVQIASSRSDEIHVQNNIRDLEKADRPPSIAGRPVGSLDLKARRNRQQTTCQLHNSPWVAATQKHSASLQELFRAYRNTPHHLQKTFRTAIAVQSRHRMASGMLDVGTRHHKTALRTRQEEIDEITGHDSTCQVKKAILISTEEIKEILDAIGTVLDKQGSTILAELGFAFSQALTTDQALKAASLYQNIRVKMSG